MCRQARFYKPLYVRRQSGRCGKASLENDEGFDDFSAQRARFADRGRQCDGRMTDQAVLDLAGPDAKTGRRNDVVIATDETDIALVIHDTLVASRQPIADEL